MPAAPFVGAFGGGTIDFTWIPHPNELATRLLAVSSALEDRSGPLALSRQIAIDDTREHFEKQESPEGEAWAPWAPSYEPIARVTNIGEILQRTMALQSAATNPGAYPVTADSLYFSTGGLPYYWFWNYEGTGGGQFAGLAAEAGERARAAGYRGAEARGSLGIGSGRALPARPMVGISFEAMLQILEVFEAWFTGAVNTFFTRGGRVVGAFRDPSGRFASPPS